MFSSVHFSHSVMSDSATPWTTACQSSLSVTNSWGPPKPMSIELVMPSNHLILCRPLLLLPSIFPSIRVFSSESALHIRWPKYCSFSFNISPSNEYSGLIPLGLTGWISLQSKGLSRVFSSATIWMHQFSGINPTKNICNGCGVNCESTPQGMKFLRVLKRQHPTSVLLSSVTEGVVYTKALAGQWASSCSTFKVTSHVRKHTL